MVKCWSDAGVSALAISSGPDRPAGESPADMCHRGIWVLYVLVRWHLDNREESGVLASRLELRFSLGEALFKSKTLIQ